jgi:hypothetical protein
MLFAALGSRKAKMYQAFLLKYLPVYNIAVEKTEVNEK